jgi:hypothetical protein
VAAGGRGVVVGAGWRLGLFAVVVGCCCEGAGWGDGAGAGSVATSVVTAVLTGGGSGGGACCAGATGTLVDVATGCGDGVAGDSTACVGLGHRLKARAAATAPIATANQGHQRRGLDGSATPESATGTSVVASSSVTVSSSIGSKR